MSFDFLNVQKAPKGAGSKKCLSAAELCYELGLGVLQLSLAAPPQPVERGALKAVRPVLAVKYTQRYDTIHTYLGAGRDDDGLGLYRARPGPYPVCRQNAELALKRLNELGHPPAKVAAIMGMAEADLLAAVASLPPFASLPAKPVVASPVAPAASGAATAPTAPLSAEEQEAARKAAREARQQEKDAALAAEIAERCRAEAAAAEAARTPEQNAELDKLLNDCLEDEESEGGDK